MAKAFICERCGEVERMEPFNYLITRNVCGLYVIRINAISPSEPDYCRKCWVEVLEVVLERLKREEGIEFKRMED